MQQPDYTIKAKEAEIPLLFIFQTFLDYTEAKGIEYEDLQNNVTQGVGIKTKDMADLLLAAHKNYCEENSQECSATIKDARKWIDAIGTNNSEKYQELYVLVAAKLFGKTVAELKAKVEEEEKKRTSQVSA